MTLHLLARPQHPAAPASATVWKMLIDRQHALLHRRARPAYTQALAGLGLTRHALPDLPVLAVRIRERTGWTLLYTGAPVAEAAYYAALARRELPVVSRLRTFSEFDRPASGPDLFADVLGRVPLLLEPGYAAALHQLGQVGLLAATPAAGALLRRFVAATFGQGLLAAGGGAPQPYGATLLTSAHALHALAATAPAGLLPLAGATRLLAGEAGAPRYFVADGWAGLSAELHQLRGELLAMQRPAPGPHSRPAGVLADSRASVFASRAPNLRAA